MKFKNVLLGFSLFISVVSFSQETKKEVLFTINEKPYYTDEFIRVYNKNLSLVKDDSQKDLDHYLDLFVGYKLKINKANALGLQEGKQYQSELKSYRNQLSRNYLTDTKVTQELLEEAYTRSLKEINASHILFLVDENASPADTLKAYKTAMDVRKKAIEGGDFGILAQQYSQDPSAAENKGELGYFSVFRMVYPFETGAYNTKKGDVSKPVRSRFGYHLIKVNDIRDNRGEISVAHIMILNQEESNSEGAIKAKSTINDIYKKLQQGEDFGNLAKQFSQDQSTASNGGVLNRFGSGDLSATAFEDVAFSLKKPGEISAPFQTQFGWHIVKLIEKYPVKTLDEVKDDFEAKIKRDDRSKIIADSMNEKLKKKYPVKKDNKAYTKAIKAINDDVYFEKWELPANINQYSNDVLFVINNDKKVTSKDFLEYVKNNQRSTGIVRPVSKFADILYNKFTEQELNIYYNANLENEFQDFAAIMQEYRDGLLLFELMEKEIWDKAKADSIGLEKFYLANIHKYQWNDRVDVDVYSSTDKKTMKKALKYLKKKKSTDFIKENLNTENSVNIMVNSGIFEQESEVLPKQKQWKTGLSEIIKEGEYYFITNTKRLLPKGPKTLEENRGRVINDYQQYLESRWIDDLKQEFQISVNTPVFDKVKKQLAH